MRVAEALRIVIEAAEPRGDATALKRLRLFLDAASPLLALKIEDCAALELPGMRSASTRRALVTALHRGCAAALVAIPPIDHRATRQQAKRALRAVAAIERLAAVLARSLPLARSRAA